MEQWITRVVACVFAISLVLSACSSAERWGEQTTVPRGWPVASELARISSPFGAVRPSGRHQGLDLSCPRGTSVRATADGIVEFAGRSGAYGRMIVIDHGNGWQTVYAHLRRLKTKEGRSIRRGAVIGTVGKSGNASGYHLHYELRYLGRSVDPKSTLQR